MKSFATLAATLVALACASPLRAHHSVSVIDITTPVWVKGTVVEYRPINPHAMIELEVRGGDGQAQRWTVEGPNPGRLERYHLAKDFLQAGDVIEACGFVPKATPTRTSPPPRFIHSQLLLLPNGQMQLWGPYGKLDNCVRPGDSKQSWLNFLSNPMARDLWCGYRAAAPLSPLASKALVDDIDREMTPGCH
jgi:hypothetical protein